MSFIKTIEKVKAHEINDTSIRDYKAGSLTVVPRPLWHCFPGLHLVKKPRNPGDKVLF